MKSFGLILYGSLASSLSLAFPLLVTAGLVPGGTWVWADALMAVGVFAAMQAVGIAVLLVINPQAIEVRNQGIVSGAQKRQPLADAIVSTVLFFVLTGLLIFLPMDVFWLRLLGQVGDTVSIVGGGAAAVSLVGMYVVLAQNEFAAPNVQDQSEQGQRLIDKGLYGVVRHPFYTCLMGFFCGLTLWLGSYAGLLGCGLLLTVLAARMMVEEQYLSRNLAGYDAYLTRVRWRIVPYLL
ncbi:MAG: methyltransferase family protein [Candidatus Phaeomarinobacter sp.]